MDDWGKLCAPGQGLISTDWAGHFRAWQGMAGHGMPSPP